MTGKGVGIMNYRISGKNIEVTEGLRTAVQDKLNKLEKYFTDETEIQVTFSVEKDRQKIEVTIPVKGSVIRAEQVSDDMYVSIDLVEEVIERQVNRYKKKLVDQQQNAAFFQKEFLEDDEADDEEIRIIRSKKFAVKPMDAEEACIQMELLGHNFFVFLNAETDEVNVVYKRKGNTYGLIEPEY
jgi:putative sigma-54 modulation protein